MSPRPDISMTAAEIAGFLAGQTRVVVAALDNGAPVGTVAAARFVDGALTVTLPADDPVAVLLEADDRVCVIAEQFPTYYEIKGVTAHGRAALTVAPDGTATFPLGLTDVTSFDFAKLPRAGTGSGKEG